MKKIFITLIIGLSIVSVAIAAVSVTITVPDAYVTQVLDAMAELAGTHMTLEARGHETDTENEFDGRVDFRIAPKGEAGNPSETNQEFAKRFTMELLKAAVKTVKNHEENERYRDEISKVSPPDDTIPDGVVE